MTRCFERRVQNSKKEGRRGSQFVLELLFVNSLVTVLRATTRGSHGHSNHIGALDKWGDFSLLCIYYLLLTTELRNSVSAQQDD